MERLGAFVTVGALLGLMLRDTSRVGLTDTLGSCDGGEVDDGPSEGWELVLGSSLGGELTLGLKLTLGDKDGSLLVDGALLIDGASEDDPDGAGLIVGIVGARVGFWLTDGALEVVGALVVVGIAEGAAVTTVSMT